MKIEYGQGAVLLQWHCAVAKGNGDDTVRYISCVQKLTANLRNIAQETRNNKKRKVTERTKHKNPQFFRRNDSLKCPRRRKAGEVLMWE